jgi:hypothetical protein
MTSHRAWAERMAAAVLKLHKTLRKSDRFNNGIKPPRNEEATTMSQQTVIAKGAHVFEGLVELTAKQHKCSTSKAVDIVMKSQSGRDALALAKRCDGASFLKLGNGDLPEGAIDGSSGRANPHHDSYGYNPPRPPTARRPHPLDYSVDRYQHEDEGSGEADDEGHRLAAGAYDAMNEDIAKWMRQDRSLTKSKALDRFRTTYPNAWRAAMKYKPASPPSNRPLV